MKFKLLESIGAVDSQGNELTDEQVNYFKNSKIRDDSGNLLVCYHGSPDGTFSKFDTHVSTNKKSEYQLLFGSHFTMSKEVADAYSKGEANTIKHTKVSPRVYEVYLNIENPLDLTDPNVSVINSPTEKGIKLGLKDDTERFNEVVKLLKKNELRLIYKDSTAQSIALPGLLDSLSTKRAEELVRAMGYDGVIYDARYSGDNAYRGNEYKVDKSFIALESNQIKSIDNRSPSNSDDINEELLFEDDNFAEDNYGRKLSEDQIKFFKDSKVREGGKLKVLYHQTPNKFTKFNVRQGGGGDSDYQTPFGIFMKSLPNDIGIKGNIQMALYANITNPLVVNSRDHMDYMMRRESKEYSEAVDAYNEVDKVYSEKANELDRLGDEMYKKIGRHAYVDSDEFKRISAEEEAVFDEWHKASNEAGYRGKEILTKIIKGKGYDGVILKSDAGSFGRHTDAIIAFDPSQVKSISNEHPSESDDINEDAEDWS